MDPTWSLGTRGAHYLWLRPQLALSKVHSCPGTGWFCSESRPIGPQGPLVKYGHENMGDESSVPAEPQEDVQGFIGRFRKRSEGSVRQSAFWGGKTKRCTNTQLLS